MTTQVLQKDLTQSYYMCTEPQYCVNAGDGHCCANSQSDQNTKLGMGRQSTLMEVWGKSPCVHLQTPPVDGDSAAQIRVQCRWWNSTSSGSGHVLLGSNCRILESHIGSLLFSPWPDAITLIHLLSFQTYIAPSSDSLENWVASTDMLNIKCLHLGIPTTATVVPNFLPSLHHSSSHTD